MTRENVSWSVEEDWIRARLVFTHTYIAMLRVSKSNEGKQQTCRSNSSNSNSNNNSISSTQRPAWARTTSATTTSQKTLFQSQQFPKNCPNQPMTLEWVSCIFPICTRTARSYKSTYFVLKDTLVEIVFCRLHHTTFADCVYYTVGEYLHTIKLRPYWAKHLVWQS